MTSTGCLQPQSESGDGTPRGGSRLGGSSGSGDIDAVLLHHLKHAHFLAGRVAGEAGPLRARAREAVGALVEEGGVLEELLGLARSLPAVPSIGELLGRLGESGEAGRLWESAVVAMPTKLLAPVHILRSQLIKAYGHIIRAKYPDLVHPGPLLSSSHGYGISTSLGLVCSAGEVDEMDEGGLGAGHNQRLPVHPGLPRPAHPLLHGEPRPRKYTPPCPPLFDRDPIMWACAAWICASLDSGLVGNVEHVMRRLRHVPVLPPLPCLASVARLALAHSPELRRPIGSICSLSPV